MKLSSQIAMEELQYKLKAISKFDDWTIQNFRTVRLFQVNKNYELIDLSFPISERSVHRRGVSWRSGPQGRTIAARWSDTRHVFSKLQKHGARSSSRRRIESFRNCTSTILSPNFSRCSSPLANNGNSQRWLFIRRSRCWCIDPHPTKVKR